MIDNYDSFTYNLVQYFAELGADVKVARNDEITLEEIERLAPQHLVISPGPCTPNEAGISVAAIKKFANKIDHGQVWGLLSENDDTLQKDLFEHKTQNVLTHHFDTHYHHHLELYHFDMGIY